MLNFDTTTYLSISQVLAARHPEKFGWTIRHYDELFLVLNASVQQYYVRRFGECNNTYLRCDKYVELTLTFLSAEMRSHQAAPSPKSSTT